MGTVQIIDPSTALHGGGLALVSDAAGQIHADRPHGLFAGDTRVLSTYQFEVNGCPWTLLGRTCTGHGSGQWHFQNRCLRDPWGTIEPGEIVFTLNRRVDGALHDDYTVTSFARRPVRLLFVIRSTPISRTSSRSRMKRSLRACMRCACLARTVSACATSAADSSGACM